MSRRVVITGMGVVSPLGGDLKTTWDGLIGGASGIKKIDEFDVADLSSKIAGMVPRGPASEGKFNADDWMAPKEQRKVDTFIIYAMGAASQAVEDAGWIPQDEESRERTGVMIGSGIGGLPRICDTAMVLAEKGPRRINPFFIPSSLINLASGNFSIKYGFKGPNHAPVTACSTGAHAIGDAARIIKYGDADVMVAGGAEAAVCRLGIGGFAASRALSQGFNERPTEASRPWDKQRDGFIMGEGAGVVVLEEYEHAKRRGARIYAEVAGYGMSGDANHITAPAEDGNGAYRSMGNAIRDAKVRVEDIGYINAHGTSTPLGDMIEFRAVQRLLGPVAKSVSMSSTKSSIGHLLGAAGGVEAIFTVKALTEGVLPPTLNLHEPEEETANMDLVPLKAKEKNFSCALTNSFGFGGTNASLVLKKID